MYIVQQLLYFEDDMVLGEMRVFADRKEAGQCAEKFGTHAIALRNLLTAIEESPRAETFLENIKSQVQGMDEEVRGDLDFTLLRLSIDAYPELLNQKFCKPVAHLYSVNEDGLAELIRVVDREQEQTV